MASADFCAWNDLPVIAAAPLAFATPPPLTTAVIPIRLKPRTTPSTDSAATSLSEFRGTLNVVRENRIGFSMNFKVSQAGMNDSNATARPRVGVRQSQ